LFISIFLLQLGTSILAPFDALAGFELGFNNIQLGLLGASHFTGFIFGCYIAPLIMSRVGHVRSFTIFASLSVLGSLMHPLFIDPYFWSFLRVLAGMSIAGCFTIVEGWLNAKVSNSNRGGIFGSYRTVDNGGAAIGSLFIGLLDTSYLLTYNLIGVFLCLCILPLAFTANIPPTIPKSPSLNIVKTFTLSPLSFISVVVVGATTPAIRMLGPIYGVERGFSPLEIGIFISLALLGGVLSQIPLGYLADKFDRRWLLIFLSLSSLMICCFITIFGTENFLFFSCLVFLFSFFASPIFSVAAAHANDFSDDTFYIDLAASLIFIFGISAILSPIIVSGLFEVFGSGILFVYIGMIHLSLGLFGCYRMTIRPSSDRKSPYLILPRTSFVFLKMFKNRKNENNGKR
jgi:MFS family permease